MVTRFLGLLPFYLSHLVYAISFAGPQQSKQSIASLTSFSSPSPSSISTTFPNVTEESHFLTTQSINITTRRVALHNATTHSGTLARNHTFTHTSHLPSQTAQPGTFNPPGHGLNPGTGQNPARLIRKGPSVAQIFFEVLGGIAGLVVLLAISRCIYIYKRTPASRRPSPEIREIDRALALFRRLPIHLLPERPPPPPYQPPPPEYNASSYEWRTRA